MLRYFGVVVFSLLMLQLTIAQEVVATHEVLPGNLPNEYTIKTSVKGLEGVDIARIKYIIDNTHTYKPSPNNALFSDRNESYIKFYVMAIPASGELNVELGIVLAKEDEFKFPVEFQYSKNEEKKQINLPELIISGASELVAENTSNNESNEQTENESEVITEKTLAEKVAEEKAAEEAKMAEELATQKLAEETKAKELAMAEAKVKEEAAKKAAEEKAKQDEIAAKTATEKVVEEKSAEETKIAEELAAQKLAEETARTEEAKAKAEATAKKQEEERLAKELAMAETKAKEEAAKKAAEEKAAKEAKIVEEKVREEEVKQPVTSSKESSQKYTVQILSLAKFSEERLASYCKLHNLKKDDLIKRKVGDLMKISYGNVDSKNEANQLRQTLQQQHNVNESFVITLP
jgi:hypothetical protein